VLRGIGEVTLSGASGLAPVSTLPAMLNQGQMRLDRPLHYRRHGVAFGVVVPRSPAHPDGRVRRLVASVGGAGLVDEVRHFL
jgi:hypothetical protein